MFAQSEKAYRLLQFLDGKSRFFPDSHTLAVVRTPLVEEYNTYMGDDNIRSAPMCPKCLNEGIAEPRPRTLQPSGTYAPYCAPHTREYQRAKYSARRVLLKAESHTPEEVKKAIESLVPRQRGRRPGDNMCPRCHTAERKRGYSYCPDCTRQYRTERNERVRLAELQAALDIEKAKAEEAVGMYSDRKSVV